MYAIVDIETTGGSPKNSRITEVAIILHDGKEIVKRYSTLINPQCPIPYYITQVTGITNEMVKDAPPFYEVAKDIVELTREAVFVAHNVNFDYSFIREAFRDLGYNFTRKTLCTVRLSRKAFAGLPSYSLGRLCQSLNIQIKDRHRALGDAEATAILFGKIMETTGVEEVSSKRSLLLKKSAIPPLLPENALEKLPLNVTGIYYFHNLNGDVLYVGKSKDIRKRVIQHFSAAETKKAVQLHHQIASISYENTGSELVALLMESEEIKRLKPLYNSAQKRTRAVPLFGIFNTTDADGYINFYIKEPKGDELPLQTADNIQGIREILYKAVEKFQLCLTKCSLYNLGGPCFDYQLHKCKGACISQESSESYNKRALQAIDSFSFLKDSFFIPGEGRHEMEQSLIFIENGKYRGYGFADLSRGNLSAEDLREVIKKANHNADIERILYAFLKNGYKKIPYQNIFETE